MALHIVVDENVPLAREAFEPFGDVELRPGRAIDATAVERADVLVVRSVTRVGEALLARSPVRFVGTATIGTDHVDLPWLERRGIFFAAAPGCNARSVAEYVVAALLELELDLSREWRGAVLGVVGVGNVGSRVAALAHVLGLEVLSCDPPRAEREPHFRSSPLDEVVARADVVTMHVPRARGGPHPTHHLLDAGTLGRLRDGAVVINTSRGGVVDDEALRRACASGRLHAVLDVWESEPEPTPELIDVVRLATPHVAGYSLDGKLAGTRMIAEALARFLAREGRVDADVRVPSVVGMPIQGPPISGPPIALASTGRAAVREAVRAVYAIRDDDARFREALAGTAPGGERGRAFDRLRRDYPVRRELAGHRLVGPALERPERELLSALGFAMV